MAPNAEDQLADWSHDSVNSKIKIEVKVMFIFVSDFHVHSLGARTFVFF